MNPQPIQAIAAMITAACAVFGLAMGGFAFYVRMTVKSQLSDFLEKLDVRYIRREPERDAPDMPAPTPLRPHRATR